MTLYSRNPFNLNLLWTFIIVCLMRLLVFFFLSSCTIVRIVRCVNNRFVFSFVLSHTHTLYPILTHIHKSKQAHEDSNVLAAYTITIIILHNKINIYAVSGQNDFFPFCQRCCCYVVVVVVYSMSLVCVCVCSNGVEHTSSSN